MDIRIGVTYSTRELEVEMPEDADRAKLQKSIAAALADGGQILWLTDRKGRDVGVPADKIAYIEIGATDSHSIGFGA